ncbi:MAG: ribonuclease HII [bacterium]
MAGSTGKNPLFPELKSSSAPDLSFENRFREMGFQAIAGVDEAGRGPLAGPVVAAAVVLPETLPKKSPLWKVRDSKTLAKTSREAIYRTIAEEAADCSWAMCEPAEIDSMNIHAASLEAMKRAVMDLDPLPHFCLVDGKAQIPGPVPSRALVKGDACCLSIAAASVLAKVIRDSIMENLHHLFPHYQFRLHKGYGTAEHRKALEKHGPCPAHRKSFKGVKEFL